MVLCSAICVRYGSMQLDKCSVKSKVYVEPSTVRSCNCSGLVKCSVVYYNEVIVLCSTILCSNVVVKYNRV